ncbi:MAG: hypothetical protein C4527_28080 [Candidatus Omnitrophota bacterium]|nr:MAG: hypothetical protein C4527_28080 [Candidatus Omnitrophota bacterium]
MFNVKLFINVGRAGVSPVLFVQARTFAIPTYERIMSVFIVRCDQPVTPVSMKIRMVEAVREPPLFF